MTLHNPAFFSWLLAASLSLVILWMVFTCFFRQWTFFALNRWILIGGTCLCLSLPLLSPYVTGTLFAPESVVPNLSLPLSSLPALQADVNQSVETAAAPTARLNSIWLWATLLYGAGVILMAARSWRAIRQLKTVRSGARLLRSSSIANVWVQNQLPTFSFGRNIFLNTHALSLSPGQLASVQRHEEAHVLQNHSADNIFFEVVSAVFWFNPFVRKLARHLRDVHEFLADLSAAGEHTHITEYQELLVAMATGTPGNRVGHSFSDSQFYRRIVMLNKPKTKAMESVKLFLLVPACAAAIFISACVDTDRNVPENPQGIVAGSNSGPVISKITWTGNKVHSSAELDGLLGVKVGDRYDRKMFEEMLSRGTQNNSVLSLYMNDGYLFFYTDVDEKLIGEKVELTINVHEQEQAWVKNVTITEKGGGNTLSRHVRPLLDVKEGQLFNRSLLITSQEKVAKSGFVNPDSVRINPYPISKTSDGASQYVDIEFVVQKP